jgi:hypothetical protein
MHALDGNKHWREEDGTQEDVDAVRMAPLSEEEKKCLQVENQCFFCKNQGHISRNCQKKKSRQQGGGTPPMNQGNQPHAWTTKAEGTADDATPAVNSANALQMIKGLNEEERT